MPIPGEKRFIKNCPYCDAPREEIFVANPFFPDGSDGHWKAVEQHEPYVSLKDCVAYLSREIKKIKELK